MSTASSAINSTTPSPNRKVAARFSALDYVLFIATLLTSAAIGIYYAIKARGAKQTTKEVLLANKTLGVLPGALTLAATFISAIAILSYSAEIYQYGTMYCYYGLVYCVAYPISAYVFLPVFYRLNIDSCYEYLELRFNRWVRITASTIFTFQILLYMGLVLYAPALALSSVTDFSIAATIVTTGLVATFYTGIGGAKAVIWTTILQLVLILVGLLAVVIGGSINVGGMSRAWELAQKGARVQFSDFRPDPTIRHSFWSMLIGGTFMTLTLFAANQMSIQRYLSMPKLESAQKAILCNIPLSITALLFFTLSGLIVYATYADCDPRKAGHINQADQLLPYFVMDKLGYVMGLPGLFVSAVYGASLSTLAGGFNAMAAVILTDFVKPAYLLKKKHPMEDTTAANISKVLACALGVISIGLAFLFTLGESTVVQMAISIFGMAGGPLLGTFCLGMFIPWANWKGAFSGLLISVITMFSLGISAAVVGIKPVSLPIGEACLNSSLEMSNTSLAVMVPARINEVVAANWAEGGAIEILKLSYQYYSFVGVLLVLAIGIVVSALTGFTDPKTIDPKLLIPVYRICCCCLPQSWRDKLKCDVHWEKADQVEHAEKSELSSTAGTAQANESGDNASKSVQNIEDDQIRSKTAPCEDSQQLQN